MPRNASPIPPPTPVTPRAGPARRWLLGLALAVALAHVAVVYMAGPTDRPTTPHPPSVQAFPPPPAPGTPPTAVQTAPIHPASPSGPFSTATATPAPPGPNLAGTSPQPAAPRPGAANATRPPENSTQNSAYALSEKKNNATNKIATHTASLPPSDARPEPTTPPIASPAENGGADEATVPRRVVVPGSVELRYAVSASRKGMTLSADSTLRLTVSDQRYDAQLTLQAWLAGARVQTSRGELDPHWGLVPQRFGDKNRSKAEQAAHFDRSRQPAAVRFSANTPDAPLPVGAQDRLSVLLQLAAMLAGEPQRYTTGQRIRIYTAGPRDAEWWDFEVKGPETLDLPAGPMTALHLLRTPTQPYDNRVELWMAPALGHLPVRVLWTQANGDVVDQRLSGHSP